MKRNLNSVQKLTLSAMMVAMTTLLTVVCKMFSSFFGIPGIRFARISLGPAIIMFVSLFMGPFYGGIVGGSSDLLASWLYPTGVYNPIYTIIAVGWGVLPWALSLLFRRFKNVFSRPYVLFSLMIILLGALAASFYGTTLFDESIGDGAVWIKPTLLAVLFVLEVAIGVGLFFENKYFSRSFEDAGENDSPYSIGLSALICEILLSVLATAGALVFYYEIIAGKSSKYGFHYMCLFLMVVAPINILINTSVSSWLLIFARRFFLKGARGSEVEK